MKLPNKISVIVAIYNEENYLAELLEALAIQRYAGWWELLIVNNRCTDGSMQIAKKYAKSFRHLKMMDALEKQGKPYALNLAIKEATGDALVFTDGHCTVAPDWLEKMAFALAKHDFVAGAIDVEKLNTGAPNRTAPFTGTKHKFMGYLPYCIGANMGISKRAMHAVGGFAESAIIGQDADISFRLQLAGYPLFDQLDAIVHMRYRETVGNLLRQHYKYAFAHTYLYNKFRVHGMKRRGYTDVLKSYLNILRSLTTWPLRSKKEKQLCLRSVASHWGRIRGSVFHRVLYL